MRIQPSPSNENRLASLFERFETIGPDTFGAATHSPWGNKSSIGDGNIQNKALFASAIHVANALAIQTNLSSPTCINAFW